ncbi:hypothetical protein Q6312_28570, partial [Klebsiella pneumoniae]|uniref:hypothetical protein n=1 Tax=Klebsiella pneumoniae TaxID=573 RepID=UPI0027318F6C
LTQWPQVMSLTSKVIIWNSNLVLGACTLKLPTVARSSGFAQIVFLCREPVNDHGWHRCADPSALHGCLQAAHAP